MNKAYIPWIRNVVGVGVLFLPLPWVVRILLIASMVYWLSPVIIYLTQRMPTVPMIERLPDSTPSMPANILHRLEQILLQLQQIGFVELARLQSSDPKAPGRGILTLLQHPTASDVAHVIVAKGDGISSETVAFSRPRVDGSRLSTSTYTLRSPFPPAPQDNALRLSGTRPAADLWRIHQVRVQNDPTATSSPSISDVLAFQMRLEAESIERRIQSGHWQRDPGHWSCDLPRAEPF